MLKAVLMDIDDTLLDFGKCAEQAMRIGFAEWGLLRLSWILKTG